MSRYQQRLRCVRCQREYPDPSPELIGAGCLACAADGVPANVHPVYALQPTGDLPCVPDQPGIFRHRDLMPLNREGPVVSLGEGRTPVVALPGLARRVGLPTVLVKDESRNPTWSYKDRLAAVATSKALQLGVDTVVVASTGNHGAAIAAYAAAAGIRCVVLTNSSVPATMKTLMQAYGAHVVALREPRDRWSLMKQLVSAHGWMAMSGFSDPPAGSHPYGVDGYKSIAYELWEQMPELPDAVVVPVAYGDGLAGIARGFADLRALGLIDKLPRMIAAEPFGPLAQALEHGADTAGPVPVRASVAFSTASPFGTQQSLHALRSTDGLAVASPDNDQILKTQLQVARESGLYLEASSVTAAVGLVELAQTGQLGGVESVVLIGTSTGLKDVGATAGQLAEVAVIEPTVAAVDQSMAEVGLT